MEIKSISLIETGKGVFLSRYGVVETKQGQSFVYTLEYNQDTWKDENDYFDNIRSDFESESKYDNFAKDEMGLFVKVEDWV